MKGQRNVVTLPGPDARAGETPQETRSNSETKRSRQARRKRETAMAEKKNTEKKITRINLMDADKNTYTLEFNKRTVKAMERNGFKMDTDYPYTMVDDLFRGAFQMHHKGMSRERIEEIWAQQTKKEDLLTALIQLYNAPMEEMMSDAETEDETPTWTVV